MMPFVPILMYHQVSDRVVAGFEKYTVSTRTFALQVRWMKQLGYETIGIEELPALANERTFPRRPVVITFDDGFRECFENATPVLENAGYTATFYLVTGLMGGKSEWLGSSGISLPLMEWEHARELEAAGFRCGAHGLTHLRLTTQSDEVCRSELINSRAELEQQLGHPVYDLAYPFGACDDRVRRFARAAGYRSACSVRIGLSGADDDCMALSRVPVNGNESFVDFACRLQAAATTGDYVRQRALRLRNALRGKQAIQ